MLQSAEGVFGDPVPFEEDWPPPAVAHALGPYIAGVVTAFGSDPAPWAITLLSQRFKPQEV